MTFTFFKNRQMKKIAIYVFALILSFEVYAIESMDKATENFQQQQSQAGNRIIKEQNARTAPWSQASASIDTTDEVTSKSRPELFTELFIYTLIILVYSVYWYKNNRPAN